MNVLPSLGVLVYAKPMFPLVITGKRKTKDGYACTVNGLKLNGDEESIKNSIRLMKLMGTDDKKVLNGILQDYRSEKPTKFSVKELWDQNISEYEDMPFSD